MKPIWIVLIIIGLVALTATLIYVFAIPITEIQILGLSVLIFFIFIFIIAYYLVKRLKPKIQPAFDSAKAWEFAKQWWYTRFGEKLVKDEMLGGERWFGNPAKLFYAFYAHRESVGPKAGQPIQIVVKTYPRVDAAWWDDQPPAEAEEDPFHGFKTEYTGSPTEAGSPETDPSFYRRGYRQPGPLIQQTIRSDKDEFEPFKEKRERD